MISIKTKKEINTIKEGGMILAEIMEKLRDQVQPGLRTEELERASKALIFNSKAEPAFLNYQGFPATLCASLNSQIVHAVPSSYALKEGDILSLDLGVKYKGYYTDMAITVGVGEIDFEERRLLKATRKSLKMAIQKAKVGNTFGDIGNTVQRHIESQGFSVIRDLCGHGIGKILHEDPQILNYGQRGKGEEIKEGMVFCVEPMASMGDYRIKKGADGFSFETKDGSLSAHFEHTMAIINGKAVVLTV